MQQERGKVTILGYFPTSNKAEKAKAVLEDKGIKVIQVDRISRYGTSFDAEMNNPVAGRAETLTGLTLNSENRDGFSDPDSRVLKGADPSVYSMAGTGYGMAGGAAFLLTVVTEDANVEKVVETIKSEGGTV